MLSDFSFLQGASVGVPIAVDLSPPGQPGTNTAPLSNGGIAGIVIAGVVVIVFIVLVSIFVPKMQLYAFHEGQQQHQLKLQHLGAAPVHSNFEGVPTNIVSV